MAKRCARVRSPTSANRAFHARSYTSPTLSPPGRRIHAPPPAPAGPACDLGLCPAGRVGSLSEGGLRQVAGPRHGSVHPLTAGPRTSAWGPAAMAGHGATAVLGCGGPAVTEPFKPMSPGAGSGPFGPRPTQNPCTRNSTGGSCLPWSACGPPGWPRRGRACIPLGDA
jgi:hypothetical protein